MPGETSVYVHTGVEVAFAWITTVRFRGFDDRPWSVQYHQAPGEPVHPSLPYPEEEDYQGSDRGGSDLTAIKLDRLGILTNHRGCRFGVGQRKLIQPSPSPEDIELLSRR